jgi:hypothetical protein
MTVIGAGASGIVSWAVFEGRGVTYRVSLRGLDDRKPGVDLTTPIAAISFVDPKVEPMWRNVALGTLIFNFPQ